MYLFGNRKWRHNALPEWLVKESSLWPGPPSSATPGTVTTFGVNRTHRTVHISFTVRETSCERWLNWLLGISVVSILPHKPSRIHLILFLNFPRVYEAFHDVVIPVIKRRAQNLTPLRSYKLSSEKLEDFLSINSKDLSLDLCDSLFLSFLTHQKFMSYILFHGSLIAIELKFLHWLLAKLPYNPLLLLSIILYLWISFSSIPYSYFFKFSSSLKHIKIRFEWKQKTNRNRYI